MMGAGAQAWELAAPAWDPCDDAPAEDLLAAAGWSSAAVERCRVLYDSLRADSDGPSGSSVTSLLANLGLGDDAPHCCRAIFRGPSLSFASFVIGLAALCPNTVHGGVWNGLRAQYIFRCFDRDGDGILSLAELGLLLLRVRQAYGQPPLALHELQAEARRSLEQLLGPEAAGPGGGAPATALSLPLFRDGVGGLKLRGCSRLFRVAGPLFPPAPHADVSLAPPQPPEQLQMPQAPAAAPAPAPALPRLQAAAAAPQPPPPPPQPPQPRPSSAPPASGQIAAWWEETTESGGSGGGGPGATGGGAAAAASAAARSGLCGGLCGGLGSSVSCARLAPPGEPAQASARASAQGAQTSAAVAAASVQVSAPSPSRHASPMREAHGARGLGWVCGLDVALAAALASTPPASAPPASAPPSSTPPSSAPPHGMGGAAAAAAAKLSAAVAAEQGCAAAASGAAVAAAEAGLPSAREAAATAVPPPRAGAAVVRGGRSGGGGARPRSPAPAGQGGAAAARRAG